MVELTIGVLALQGDFERHLKVLRSLGVTALEVRRPSDLEECDALIIPGGESTTMTRQLEFCGLDEKIRGFAEKKPIFGTCAGIILMSRQTDSERVLSLGLLDIEIRRNAYGRQADSFSAEIELHIDEKDRNAKAVFIRAPQIRSWDPNLVKVLAEYDDNPVLVLQGIHMGATFHPELTTDATIHRYFLAQVSRSKSS